MREEQRFEIEELAIADIVISPDRQRKEISGVSELADSIRRVGLINPIVVNDRNELIAGERRIRAFVELGRFHIPARRERDLTEYETKVMELEENLQRQQLAFWEVSEAIAELHRLRTAENPEWNVEKTAAEVGLGRAMTYNHLSLAAELEARPHLRTKDTIVGALKQLQVEKRIEEKERLIAANILPKRSAIVKEGDALTLIRSVPDNSIDAIVTNPPFGIDLEIGGSRPYDDDGTAVTDLMIQMASEYYRVLRPDSWIAIFYNVTELTHSAFLPTAMAAAEELSEIALAGLSDPNKRILSVVNDLRARLFRALGMAGWLRAAGFTVNQLPCIWGKPNKTKGGVTSQRYQVSAYESFLLASKGKEAPILRAGRQNLFLYDLDPPETRIHEVQMPVSVCSEVLSMIAPGGSFVLDPFAGSASTGIAALDLQCNYLGFELDPEKARRANIRLQEHELNRPLSLILEDGK